MEPTKTQEEHIKTAADVAIGFEEALVVCVECGKTAGYLIAPSFSRGDQDSGILLESVTYLHGDGCAFGNVILDRVLISEKDGLWVAVDADSVRLIPHPASVPYPVIYISDHGYRWMSDQIACNLQQNVWKHLLARFAGCEIPRSGTADRSLAIETYH